MQADCNGACELTIYIHSHAEEVVDHVSPGVLCFADVERAHKVTLHAAHPDAEAGRDVQDWLNDPGALENPLFEDRDARVAAFIENSRNSTCAVIGEGDVFFVLDSHGVDPWTGHKCGREGGRAVILRLAGMAELFRFLRSLVDEGHFVTLSQVYM